ncbi:CASP-like protein 1E1 [Carex littledalei]|uniref:CASP-like protein n=1 Tax=Carex littledalei TaxID=544730 RepID=A0A833QHD1_9POAL|nr:CASP-like protein 1E1 [Carex littledalei]
MESSRVKPGLNGVEGKEEARQVAGRSLRLVGAVLRALALALTLVAAVVMGLDRQTTTIPFQLVPTLPPLHIAVTAKWSHSSAFIYFVVANVIVCIYSAFSLVASLLTGASKKTLSLAMPIAIGDLIMVALLFSSVGAAMDFGLLGLRGNSHLRWNKVCGVYGKFCEKVQVAIALSMLGSCVFLVLVILSIISLHKRSK